MKSKKMIIVYVLGVVFFILAVTFLYGTRSYVNKVKEASSSVFRGCDQYSVSGVVREIDEQLGPANESHTEPDFRP